MRSFFTKKRHFRQLIVVLLSSVAGCSSDTDTVLEETFDHLYTIQPSADITVQNRDGAILLYGSDTNEIRVQATKKAYSHMRLKQIAIDVSVQPTSVSIRVKLPPKRAWALFDRSGTVDCTVVVPAAANVSQLRLDAGEVFVEGMRGRSVHASLGDGRMFVRNCFSDIDLTLQRGNLSVSYDWWEHGTFSVHANVARGNAWAFLPSDAAFHLVAETLHGRLASDFDDTAAQTASAGPEKIDTLVHGGGKAAIKVRTVNGDVKIVEANP